MLRALGQVPTRRLPFTIYMMRTIQALHTFPFFGRQKPESFSWLSQTRSVKFSTTSRRRTDEHPAPSNKLTIFGRVRQVLEDQKGFLLLIKLVIFIALVRYWGDKLADWRGVFNCTYGVWLNTFGLCPQDVKQGARFKKAFHRFLYDEAAWEAGEKYTPTGLGGRRLSWKEKLELVERRRRNGYEEKLKRRHKKAYARFVARSGFCTKCQELLMRREDQVCRRIATKLGLRSGRD